MSRRRNYNDDSLNVMRRYFNAFDTLRENGKIKSITAYCDKYHIDKRHFYEQRRDLYKGHFQVGWLHTIIRDYGISPLWLLMGEGEMSLSIE